MEIVTERSRSDSRWIFKTNYYVLSSKITETFLLKKSNLRFQRSFNFKSKYLKHSKEISCCPSISTIVTKYRNEGTILCSFPPLEGTVYTDEYQFCRPSTVSWPMRQSRSTNILRTIAPTKILRALSNALDENVKARWSYVDNLIWWKILRNTRVKIDDCPVQTIINNQREKMELEIIIYFEGRH